MARLKILSADEFDNLYSLPKLEKQDRDFLFELDEADHLYLNSLVTYHLKLIIYCRWNISDYPSIFLALHYME